MSFFKKLLGGIIEFESDRREVDDIDPVLGPVKAAAERGDLMPALQAFTGTLGDCDTRVAVVLTAFDAYEKKFGKETARAVFDNGAKLGEPFYLFLRSQWNYARGWEARGTGTADTVGDEAAALLQEHCARAVDNLDSAAALDPSDAAPYALLIHVARGMSDEHFCHQAFEDAVARAPDALYPRTAMVKVRSPRYWGSIDEVLAFGDEQSANAPAGTALASLPAYALFEAFTATWAFEGQEEACALARDQRDSLLATLSRSVDAPGYAIDSNGYCVRQMAAILFRYGDEQARAKAELGRAGDVFVRSVWSQITASGDPYSVYKSTRQYLEASVGA